MDRLWPAGRRDVVIAMASTAVARFQQSKRKARQERQHLNPERNLTESEEVDALEMAKYLASTVSNREEFEALLARLPTDIERDSARALIAPHLDFSVCEVVN
jgi:hypothetical protein